MQTYVGTKIVNAEPMSATQFEELFGKKAHAKGEEEGYHIEYPGSYHSWSPKSRFDEAYRPLLAEERRICRETEPKTAT